eukprot:m.111549 g.111549  ORF g.111549 m.111549 type:complete len:1237 (+) comp28130_c0_seq1:346-4056(+)
MDIEEIEEIEIEVEGHDDHRQPTAPPPAEVDDDDEIEEIAAPGPYVAESMQLQTMDDAQANAALVQESFKNKIQGSRREEDDSGIAFGDKFCEKFGGSGTMPMPSAPPLTPEVAEEQCRWARSTQNERKAFPNHKQLMEFFKNNGIEKRSFEPYIKFEDIPVDTSTTYFMDRVAAARADNATRALNPKQGTPAAALKSLLYGTTPPKDFAAYGDIFLPPHLLAQSDLDTASAEKALKSNDQFDQIQLMVNEAANQYKSSWVWGEKIQGGTLEVRMDAERSKIVVLGEGYKKLNIPGLEGWRTVARGIPKDTEYTHVKDEFTIIRIYPGYIGLCQKGSRQIMRLLPGRYVLPERVVRYIGRAKIVPNENVKFIEHPDNTDPDIRQLARRFTCYYLPIGQRLFVSATEGVFVLEPDMLKRPFIFDAKAMEDPLNASNPREFMQSSSDKRYWIVRLQSGQRMVIRGNSGVDVVLKYVTPPPGTANTSKSDLNTYHLSKVYYDFDGKVYNRDKAIVASENVTSVRLSTNDILVLKDDDGNIRFLDSLNPKEALTLRPPWQALEVIKKTDNLYLYSQEGVTVARVRPASNQWPIIYDVESGSVLAMPHSIEYIFSSQEQQMFIGLADKNGREPQNFEVPGVGRVTIATVRSGQLAMCRLNNMSFFLPPMPEPYVFRPPNEYFGMVDMDNTHVHIPDSDLHRIYVPAGEWAVAMIDGRQVILDPATNNTNGSEGNGIWIFRAQQLSLAGPEAIDAKVTELFNVTRLQVPMNEIAFGVDSVSGERLIWGPGNHTINKNKGQVFQGFFRTQLEDVKIEKFDVVWNGGVRSTVDACVGFHIVSTGANNDHADLAMMRQVLNLCQNHEDLHNKVVENTKHQLFDVISQIEPLGYGATMYDADTDRDKENTVASLQDLEKMFSKHVELILKKYGIVVDNVTITKINLDPVFIKNSEMVQQARLEARQKVLVAEQELQRNRIAQQQHLQDQQAMTRQQEEESKQRDISRQREVDDIAAQAQAEALATANRKKVEFDAELARTESEAESRVRQQETKIKELEQSRKAQEVEMHMRRDSALLEAETQAIEKSAMARAEARARMEIAELTLSSTKFEVEAQKLKAEGDRASGLAKSAIELNQQYGGIEQNPELLVELLKMKASVEGQRSIAEVTARCTDPAISRMMGKLETFEDITPKLALGMNHNYMAMPQMHQGIPEFARAHEYEEPPRTYQRQAKTKTAQKSSSSHEL